MKNIKDFGFDLDQYLNIYDGLFSDDPEAVDSKAIAKDFEQVGNALRYALGISQPPQTVNDQIQTGRCDYCCRNKVLTYPVLLRKSIQSEFDGQVYLICKKCLPYLKGLFKYVSESK